MSGARMRPDRLAQCLSSCIKNYYWLKFSRQLHKCSLQGKWTCPIGILTGASLVFLPSLPPNNVCDLGHCKIVGFFLKKILKLLMQIYTASNLIYTCWTYTKDDHLQKSILPRSHTEGKWNDSHTLHSKLKTAWLDGTVDAETVTGPSKACRAEWLESSLQSLTVVFFFPTARELRQAQRLPPKLQNWLKQLLPSLK